MLEGSLPKLSDIFPPTDHQDRETFTPNAFYPNLSEWLKRSQLKAESEWFAAIASLENILLQNPNNAASRGLILSGPTALVRESKALTGFKFGVFTVKALKHLQWLGLQLPSQEKSAADISPTEIHELPLLPTDPIANERFCLVFSESFALLLVLGEDQWGLSSFQFSFDPVLTQQAWQQLRQRLVNLRYPQIETLEAIIEANGSPSPDYRLVSQFSRQLLQNLPDQSNLDLKKTKSSINSEITPPKEDNSNLESGCDLELLPSALPHRRLHLVHRHLFVSDCSIIWMRAKALHTLHMCVCSCTCVSYSCFEHPETYCLVSAYSPFMLSATMVCYVYA
ncbi:MAG: hypothetical protein ACKPGT_28445, partial [Microcystis sp.]